MIDTKKRALLGWCENNDCGEPIYTGDKHLEEVADSGSRYLYHFGCADIPVSRKGEEEN